jgi:hypothetical protein
MHARAPCHAVPCRAAPVISDPIRVDGRAEAPARAQYCVVWWGTVGYCGVLKVRAGGSTCAYCAVLCGMVGTVGYSRCGRAEVAQPRTPTAHALHRRAHAWRRVRVRVRVRFDARHRLRAERGGSGGGGGGGGGGGLGNGDGERGWGCADRRPARAGGRADSCTARPLGRAGARACARACTPAGPGEVVGQVRWPRTRGGCTRFPRACG